MRKKATTPAFQMYDVVEIDWRKGDGWQEYMCLKTEAEYAEAVRIVRGGICHAMPHWIGRTAVSFRIVDERGTVKVAE